MCQTINLQKLGKRINTARNKRNITIRHMACKLGIEPGSLANIESGSVAPSTELLFSIADILNVPVDYLLTDSLKNQTAAIDYMIHDMFVTIPDPQRKKLADMAKALLDVINDNKSDKNNGKK